MDDQRSQPVIVSYIPLDGVGARVSGSIAGEDQGLGELREIRDSIEEDLRRTAAAMDVDETKDLAIAIRGALLSLDKITFHLERLHVGLYRGNVNYPENPHDY
ncbi:hypothetical protein [Rathayibacter sp. AY1B8]|uniref:hypothetical protein n=1 Tax=Rathayibacter sp. AY1B8 TaxID=2080533 RepID=UPI000CE7843B|nr:hypothetical protein [Rathayibacter sp. AY1B8]PPI06346.1 hypothetical protein C5C63_10900 [Rathayibacter sp. AY1B8]